jgi:hypothetical protein
MICQHLQDNNIHAVLTGGAVVSIYSDDRYLTADLDFITNSSFDMVCKAMLELGFQKGHGCYFEHQDRNLLVEFPPGPLSIGDAPVSNTATLVVGNSTLNILTPTQCVMDRLAAYYYWDDEQALDQALLVANRHEVDLDSIREWSENEDKVKEFRQFCDQLSNSN